MANRSKRENRGSSEPKGCSVSVSRIDGTVVAQSAGGRELAGLGSGRTCWDMMGDIDGAERLPCEDGCAGRLVAGGKETVRPVEIDGEPYDLTCMPVNGKVVSVLTSRAGTPLETEGGDRLTPRELDVLKLLADGLTTATIAEKLQISAGTVRAHVEHMRSKLGVATRAALVSKGFRLNYLR